MGSQVGARDGPLGDMVETADGVILGSFVGKSKLKE